MRMRRGRLKKKTSDDAGGAAPEKPPTRSWRRVSLAVARACAAEVLSFAERGVTPLPNLNSVSSLSVFEKQA